MKFSLPMFMAVFLQALYGGIDFMVWDSLEMPRVFLQCQREAKS